MSGGAIFDAAHRIVNGDWPLGNSFTSAIARFAGEIKTLCRPCRPLAQGSFTLYLATDSPTGLGSRYSPDSGRLRERVAGYPAADRRSQAFPARTRWAEDARWRLTACVGGDSALLTRRQNSVRALRSRDHRRPDCAPQRSLVPVASASAQNGFFESLFGRRWSGPYRLCRSVFANSQPPRRKLPRVELRGRLLRAAVRRPLFPDPAPWRRRPRRRPAARSARRARPRSTTAAASTTRSRARRQALRRPRARPSSIATSIVPDCTCNGKDALGLVNTPVDDDPTLRPGDIVATNDGLMAYNGACVQWECRRKKQAELHADRLLFRPVGGPAPQAHRDQDRAAQRRRPATPAQVKQARCHARRHHRPTVAARTSAFRPTDSRPSPRRATAPR